MRSSYKHRSGDRSDGRLLRSLSSYSRFIPFLMPRRDDACNLYEESFDVSAADKCLRHERVNGYKGISFLHFLIAAYVRCLSMLPGINRFVSGRRIYARNTISVIMTVRRSFSIDTSGTTIKVEFEPTDTIFDVYRKINEKIDEVKSGISRDNAEEFSENLSKLPPFLLRIAVLFLRILDYFGWMPKAMLEASPFHGSMVITDAGSLRVSPASHHILNFGNLPVYLSFGAKRHVFELDRRGQTVSRKYLDVKFTFDERIVDCHYYAQFLQAMRYIFAHPEILERAPTRVIEDVG